jgi:hypothetical protein
MSATTEQYFLWVGAAVLVAFLILEVIRPTYFKEGFEGIIRYDTSFFAQYAPKRGDVGPGDEEGGYVRDPRYFNDYANVQRLGFSNDFCRVVQSKATPDILFFACALAGTENMSSTDYRTPTTKDGFKLSRDDYMRNMNNDGRDDYCRILKAPDGTYKALCNRSTDKGFDDRLVVDGQPPDDIKRLLTFYEGCVFWYRFRDDMVDYVNNTKLYTSGEIKIDETPRPVITKGIRFNGADQFLRMGDSPDLELGYIVPMRSLRAICCWVYFDEFTNNAHILDFGNGAGRDNVFLGIIGRGDASVSAEDIRPPACGDENATLPTEPSGQQLVPEMTPQLLMKTTSANVDEYSCTGFETQPRRLPASRVVPWEPKQLTKKATLLYEVWDKQQRKMRIKIEGVIPLRKWTHIAITAVELASFRPTIKVYIDGEDVYTKPSGHLPQASTTSNNYFGKSNWTNDTSEYENKDELFNGSLFDVRGYKTPMTAKKIQETVKWGKELLGVQ